MENNISLAAREQSLNNKISQLNARIEKLRLGRRILMNLLVLQQAQLHEYESTLVSLRKHNAELKKMLFYQQQGS
jgi:hypothetical protein